MLHDRNLHSAADLKAMTNMAFEINADACKLMLLVEYYKTRGERTLPVQYLKRLGFTRRQWELATKGKRPIEGRKLTDPKPVKDGLEFYGILTPHTEWDAEADNGKGRNKTYWIIGELDQDALDAIRAQRQEAAFDVIEDREPIQEEGDKIEPSAKAGTQTSDEEAYDEGYRDGHANGYEKGKAEGGTCVKYAPIEESSRGAANTQARKTLTPAYSQQEKRRESQRLALPGTHGLCTLLNDYLENLG